MFHLTVTEVAQALSAAAGQGVTVQIIIDQDNWNNHTAAALKAELNVPGITVTPSSPKFRITHENHSSSTTGRPRPANIMSLNLTSPFDVTRDYAVSTQDPGLIADFETVFSVDLANAQNGTANNPADYSPGTPSTTSNPALVSPYTILSPVNSKGRSSRSSRPHDIQSSPPARTSTRRSPPLCSTRRTLHPETRG